MKALTIAAVLLVAGLLAPLRGVHAEQILGASAFALQQTDFPPPATIVKAQVYSNDDATADKSLLNFGPNTYAQLGRMSGYYMEAVQANLEASGAVHPVVTYFHASVYSSPDGAAAALAQLRDGWDYGVAHPTADASFATDTAPGQFGDLEAPSLYVATVQTSGGEAKLNEFFFKRDRYFVEIYQTYYTKDASYGAAARPYIASIAKKLDGVANGTPVATPPPTTVDFNILKLRVEKNGATWDLTKPDLAKVKNSQKVQFIAYLTLKSAPPNVTVTADFTLSVKGQSSHMAFTKALDSTPADYYRVGLINVQLYALGTYTLTSKLTIGNVTRTATTTFKVVKSSKSKTSLHTLRWGTLQSQRHEIQLLPVQTTGSMLSAALGHRTMR